jgi:hypothetical protein
VVPSSAVKYTSIIPAVIAIEKLGNEVDVMKQYQSAKGRDWLINTLKAQHNAEVHRQLTHYGDLLKYWRDAAAHGVEITLHESEAFTSLLLLFRLAQFAADRRQELVGHS